MKNPHLYEKNSIADNMQKTHKDTRTKESMVTLQLLLFPA